MKLIYGVKDKPKVGQTIVFAIQQLLAIMAATLVVPVITNGAAGLTGTDAMSPAAALCGAGLGTLIYLLFTKFRSPVFLGSSFAFLGSMAAAFAGATTTVALGYLGLVIGAVLAGLVYVVIAIAVKVSGTGWINKLMPTVVIGPTVAIIGLSLAGNAVGDITKSNNSADPDSFYIALVCGLITLAVTMLCARYGKKTARLIPFILGILAGYAAASLFSVIGDLTETEMLKVIDYSALTNNFKEIKLESFVSLPNFTFLKAFGAFGELDGAYIGAIAVAYIPVAFVVFAEHIADHKNLSTIIEQDLLEDPGLSNTLLGDGVGSMVGAAFGGCPNTTYGESIGCVAVTGNASVITILFASIGAIVISFFTPFVAFVNTIPSCVMGGVCMVLYGFIAVSGLKMIQKVNLEQNRNLFVVSVILVAGVGGLSISFGDVKITNIAFALILGILANIMLNKKGASED